MLLIITHSEDGVIHALVEKLQEKIFRFNYDLFSDYYLELTPDYWKITSPTGHSISSKTISSCFWWKAFSPEMSAQDNYVVEEVKYIFREIYNWCRLNSLVKGNSFEFHNQLGKNSILNAASEFFRIPKTLITLNCAGIDSLIEAKTVAKSLSSAATNSNASLLTTEVDVKKLDPKFPWYLQEKVVSEFDITVFICNKKLFPYKRSRKDLKGLDWREKQNFEFYEQEWFNLKLTSKEESSILKFCEKINVDWGRLDFMRDDDQLVFLEFNANGQWLFLDPEDKDGMLDAVINYLV